MSNNTYIEVLRRVEELSVDEQLQLLATLADRLRYRVEPKPLRSIMELKGLGKEIWQGIDAQEYVNQERDSWE